MGLCVKQLNKVLFLFFLFFLQLQTFRIIKRRSSTMSFTQLEDKERINALCWRRSDGFLPKQTVQDAA